MADLPLVPRRPAPHLPARCRAGGGAPQARFWTQDEGLALLLVVDRLVPGWQQVAFAAKPALAEALLAMAAGR